VVDQSQQIGPADQSEQTGLFGKVGFKETENKTKHFRQSEKRCCRNVV